MRKLSGQVKALVGEEAPPADSAADDGDGPAVPRERVVRRQLAVVFDLLVLFYRDLLALRVGGDSARIVNCDRASELARLAPAGDPDRWARCLDALVLARRRLDANANVALVTEALAMALMQRQGDRLPSMARQ
jgi:DNA polymerase-3 subunit delta'